MGVDGRGAVPASVRKAYDAAKKPKERHAITNNFVARDCGYGAIANFEDSSCLQLGCGSAGEVCTRWVTIGL